MEYPQDNNIMPLSGGFNFTPKWKAPDGTLYRVRMRVDRNDPGYAHTHRRGYRGWVKDLDTGLRYKVYTRSCGLSHCNCDALIKEYPE